jgi:hypothetical protein
MNPHAERLRRALHAAADALADFLDAQGPAVEKPADAPTVVPNSDIAERFAREQLARRGWPAPKRGRRAG